jgi:hypothetical protein
VKHAEEIMKILEAFDVDRASDHVEVQAVLTRRAGIEAFRQVSENARPVSQLADQMRVCWWTIMDAVVEHGTPLVDATRTSSHRSAPPPTSPLRLTSPRSIHLVMIQR